MTDAGVIRYVERIERLIEEITALRQDVREVYAEAKADGHPPEILRAVVKRRAMDPATRQERDALLVIYEAAVGSEEHGPDEQRQALLTLAEAKAEHATEIRLRELAGLVTMLDPEAEKALVATIAVVLDLRAAARDFRRDHGHAENSKGAGP